MGEPTPTGDTWRARPALAAGLAALHPARSRSAHRWARRPCSDGSCHPPRDPWWFAWALGVLACALLVAVGVERAARRLLPLVTLLKLSMLFPDQAPTRFSVARTAGSVRRLEARLAETQDDSAAREEARTAETILSLSVALQSHDRRTRGHAERVRVFTDLLGEELQLSEADRYRLRWAALMHDIGKLTIAPRILNKPGALDEHEWRLMKGHPVEGARIAETDPRMARPVGERDRRAPRALRRQGVPERPGRRLDLARRSDRLGRGLLRHHDGGAILQEADGRVGGATRTGGLRRRTVRSRRSSARS